MEDTDSDGTKEFYYYYQDHLGGTTLVTDSTGTVSQLYDYYPYGSELLNSQPTSGNAPSEHSFTDKELDSDLGLYYFEARWYDSEIGRFSSQDPAQLDGRIAQLIQDPQSLNFYAYSRNNPVNLVDPDGEAVQFLVGAVAGAFVGVGVQAAIDLYNGSWSSQETYAAAAVGGLAGGSLAPVNPYLAGAVGSATQDAVQQYMDTGTIEVGEVVEAAGVGTAFGVLP